MAEFSPTDKAAIVLLALGEELASEIFRSMSQSEVKRIGAAMGRLGRIDQATVDIVMAEFKQVFDSQSIAGVRGSPEFLKKALSLAFNNSPASQEIASSLARQNYRLKCLELADSSTLFRIVRDEHPQTLATILAHAPQQMAAKLLKLFPEGLRSELITRVARLDQVSFEVLQDLDERICQELEKIGTQGTKVGGVAKAAAILNELQKDGEHVLESLGERDPQLSDDIRAQMFRFEDLQVLEPANLQVLFKKVDRGIWQLALRGASSKLLQSFAGVLSQRAFTTLTEDIEALGPQKKSDVIKAQKEIVLTALELERSGELSLKPGEEVA